MIFLENKLYQTIFHSVIKPGLLGVMLKVQLVVVSAICCLWDGILKESGEKLQILFLIFVIFP